MWRDFDCRCCCTINKCSNVLRACEFYGQDFCYALDWFCLYLRSDAAVFIIYIYDVSLFRLTFIKLLKNVNYLEVMPEMQYCVS